MVADSAFTFVASTKPVGLEHSGRNQERSVEKMTLHTPLIYPKCVHQVQQRIPNVIFTI